MLLRGISVWLWREWVWSLVAVRECCEGPGLQWVHYRDNQCQAIRHFEWAPLRREPAQTAACSQAHRLRLQDQQPAESGQGLQQNTLQFCIENIYNESESFQNESQDVRVPESFEQSQNWRGEQEKTREQRSQEPFHLIFGNERTCYRSFLLWRVIVIELLIYINFICYDFPLFVIRISFKASIQEFKLIQWFWGNQFQHFIPSTFQMQR